MRRAAALAALVMALAVSACGGAECDVKMDSDGSLDLVVNPPGENAESGELTGKLSKATNISASGGSTESVSTLTGFVQKTYADSGNTYNIDVFVEVSDGQIQGYELIVGGGVYGDTLHTCRK